MKKFLSKITALSLIAVVFSTTLIGCGQQTQAPEVAEAPTEAVEPEKPGEKPTEKPVEATTDRTPISKDEIKVGVIHITDPSEGSGYTYTHDVGIIEMQKNLGLRDDQIIRKNNINDTDPTQTETAIRDLIEEGSNIIFATSWGYMDTVEALAEEFPEVVFWHGSGYKSNSTNFNNYFGRIYQARYLSGIAAGLKTKSNLIGYVAAMDSQNSEVTGGLAAFALGVKSVNPDAKIYVKVTNSWFNPTEETNAAKALIAEGCDVLGQHVDTPNPQLEAEKAGVWGVGYNSDMQKDAPNATIVSVMWHWGVFYTEAVQRAIDGVWIADRYYAGMKEGLVEISSINESVAAEGTDAAIEEATNRIVNDGFNIFDGVMVTSDGTTVGVDGGTLDDNTITGDIKWYYENTELR